MQNHLKFAHAIFPLIFITHVAFGNEFTFDLAKDREECFYEILEQNVRCEFEFQVVSGGKLDIDVIVESPSRRAIYKEKQKEYDTFRFNTTETGEYAICFYNQYASYKDKSIYLSFETGRKNQLLKQIEEHDDELTFMESTSDEIHNNLENVIDYQTRYRLQEGYGRRFTKELNDRVLWWSLAQTFVIVMISITQVLILRRFFEKDPRPGKTHITLAHQIHVYG